MVRVRLTGHSERCFLCPASSLVLGHTGVGARIPLLRWTENQIPAVLVHPALRGHPLTFSLPPNLGVGPAAWGVTGHPLKGVCREHLRHLEHHVVYFCGGEQAHRSNSHVKQLFKCWNLFPFNHQFVFKPNEVFQIWSQAHLIPTHSSSNCDFEVLILVPGGECVLLLRL